MDATAWAAAGAIIAIPIYMLEKVVREPLSYMLGLENSHDFTFVFYAVVILGMIGVIAELLAVSDGYDAVRVREFFIVFGVMFVASVAAAFLVPLDFFYSWDEEKIPFETVYARVLGCMAFSFCLASLVFAFTLGQYWFLRIKSGHRALALYDIGRLNTQDRLMAAEERKHQATAAPRSYSMYRAPETDIDWSLFDQDTLRATIKKELRKAREARDPHTKDRHMANVEVLLSHMENLRSLPPPPARRVIADQRGKVKLLEDKRPKQIPLPQRSKN